MGKPFFFMMGNGLLIHSAFMWIYWMSVGILRNFFSQVSLRGIWAKVSICRLRLTGAPDNHLTAFLYPPEMTFRYIGLCDTKDL